MMSQSLTVGRPPTLSLHAVDVELPEMPSQPIDAFESRKFPSILERKSFSRDKVIHATVRSASIVAEIVQATQLLNPPTYTQILRLDEKMINIRRRKDVQIALSTPPSICTFVPAMHAFHPRL
jgi:hypothetical protein